MKITIDYLKSINKKMKTDSVNRALAYAELMELETEDLDPGLLMYRSYLIGKYHFWSYQENGQFDSLEQASDYFDDVFTIAYQESVGVRNSKYWFKRVHTKWELAQYSQTSSTKEKLKEYTIRKIERALEKFPRNSSLLWLKQETLNQINQK